jgi:hypothetical protein
VIDIWGVLANSLWVLGLATLLATFSRAYWAACVEKARLRAVLARPGILRAVNLSFFLVCAGLATTGRTWWGRVLWGLLAVAWVARVWMVGGGANGAGERRNGS